MSKIINYNPFRFFTKASILIGVCCCAYVINVQAQSRRSYQRRADALFKEQNYYAAAQLYKAALTGVYTNGYAMPYQPSRRAKGKKAKGEQAIYLTYQLAQSYRLYKYYNLADTLYAQYLTLTKTPDSLTRLWYGETLRANNKPEEAITQLNQFITEHATDDAYTQLAKFELANAYFNINQRNLPALFTISKLDLSKGIGSTYGLEKLNDTTFYFTQSSVDSSNKKDITYPTKLYQTNLNEPNSNTLSINGIQLDKAASHVTKDQLTIYFTAWKETYVPAKNSYAIYYAQRIHPDSAWSTPIKMSDVVNVEGYNAKQPYVTDDNRFLVFSSNKPGGFGKYDIWIAPLVNYNAVGVALNAGDSINTAGDETTPFYFTETEELFYSTNGKIGMGGLDIVKSKGSVEKNKWYSSVNLGASLNSVRDDAYYKKYSQSIGDTSYFSSDREAICCLEIFQSISLKPIDTSSIKPVDTIAKVDTPVVVFDSTQFKIDQENAVRKHLIDSINAASVARTVVNFDFAKSSIKDKERSSLDTIIQIVKDNPDLNIIIAAFTDCKGKASVNKRLAKARAQAVKKYIAKNGIPPSKINIDFYVDNHLVLPCKDDSTYNMTEQEANRRADVIVTKDKNKRWTPSGKELNIDEILNEIREGKRKITFDEEKPVEETRAERRARLAAERKAEREEKAAFDKIIQEEKQIQKEKERTIAIAKKAVEKYERALRIKEAKQQKATRDSIVREKRRAKIREKAMKDSIAKAMNDSVIKSLAEKREQAKKDLAAKKASVVADKVLTSKEKDKLIETLDSINEIKDRLLLAQINQRATSKIVLVETRSDSVHIDLYDNGVFDKDSISVIFNKKIVVYKQALKTDKAISFDIKIEAGEKKNEMIFYAENLGIVPPNSALMVITDKEGKRTEISVVNDLKNNTVIYFVKLKKLQ